MSDDRKYVKSVFKIYKQNELYLKENALPKVTASYQLVLVVSGNALSMVEDIACKRADAELYNKQVDDCIEQLSVMEKKIINTYYRTNGVNYDWQVWEGLHIGRTLYYSTKQKAIEKLALLFWQKKL